MDRIRQVVATLQTVESDVTQVLKDMGPSKAMTIYRNMVRTRALDDKLEQLLAQGHSLKNHSTLGQEATPVTACAALDEDDYLMPYHRGWAWAIGKGLSMEKIIAELLGKKTGCCGGVAGPQLADWDLKIMGRPAIQGAHLSIGAGVALSSLMRGTKQVTLAFFGDGASNTPHFHEALNLAGAWRLPIVYVCENNQYAIFSSIRDTTAVMDIGLRSAGYGMPGYVVDGNDVTAVWPVVTRAIERARRGEGPTLIEAKTYRWKGHTSIDSRHYGGYRPKAEVDEWKRRCPIRMFGEHLLKGGIASPEDFKRIEDEARAEADRAASLAVDADRPVLEDYLRNIYAG